MTKKTVAEQIQDNFRAIQLFKAKREQEKKGLFNMPPKGKPSSPPQVEQPVLEMSEQVENPTTENAPPPPPPSGPRSKPPTVAARHQLAPMGKVPFIGVPDVKFQAPRVILFAVEGWGKTSTLAYAAKPLIVMAKGESGYTTLLGRNLVPAHPTTSVESWEDLMALMDHLIKMEEIPYKTIGLDAFGGFERLCHDYVCRTQFGGDWGEKGFASFQRGFDISVSTWITLLEKLDQLRDRGVMTLLLGHTKIMNFKNPEGPDYDRYTCDVHPKTWSITHKWADAALFGKFYTSLENVDKQNKKGKATGGNVRVLYTQRRDAWDAKNRYSMPDDLDIPNEPNAVWPMIMNLMLGKAV